jgi:alginate O-acetyltransferase complex protein AlgJ
MLKTIRLLILLVAMAACEYLVVMTIRIPTLQTSEQRPLAEFPAVPQNRAELQAFFQGVDGWASDRMHYRQEFITWLNTARLALGWSPMRSVVLGKDGWLFYNGADSWENEDARGSRQFTEEQLQHWKDYLLHRDREAREHGAKFLFVMLPNKSTVYTEYWPDHYTRLSDNTRLQQIVDVMKGTGVDVIDVRAAMQEGKKLGQLYLKADTHWNMLGANIAQFEIMKKLSESFPDIQPVLYSFHNASKEEKAQLHHPSDLYYMSGVFRFNTGPQVPVVEGIGACVGQPNPGGLRQWPLAVGDCSQSIPGKAVMHWDFLQGFQRTYLFTATELPAGKRTLLMARDSYYEMLQPYFSNHFAHAEYVGLMRPIPKEDWAWMINTIKPDVIIEEMLERNLKTMMPRPGIDYPLPTDK